MNDLEADRETSVEIAPEIIRVAVARVCASGLFETSERALRLFEFLTEEALEGRADLVSFESVQPVLYETYDPEVREKVARSDRRRLHELLQRYFEQEGQEDAVHISLASDGLKLQFSFAEQEKSATSHQSRRVARRHWVPFVAGALLVTVIVFFQVLPNLFSALQREPVISPPLRLEAEKQFSRIDLLPGAEQLAEPTAQELDRLGRAHMFSFMDMARQQRVVAHSKAVIARFPNYGGTYATAAHSLSSMAILTRGSSVSRHHIEEATAMVEHAQALSPDDPWTFSAAGWVAVGLRDWERALGMSAEAHAIAGNNQEILIFRALTLLFSGNFQLAADVTAPQKNDPNSGNIGIHGFAKFYLKDYPGAVEAFEHARQQGHGHTPVGSAYLAAAYQGAGRSEEASDIVALMRRKWPTFRPELVHHVFAPEISAREGQEFVKLFCDAGWELDS